MAGASLAAEIGGSATVALLEAEAQPGYHATGRSAAFWVESYGGPQVQPLTTASGGWLLDNGFLRDRGALNIARADQTREVEQFAEDFAESGVRLEPLDREQLEHRIPGLLPDWTQGLWEPDCKDIDVGGLHNHYVGTARAAGAAVMLHFRLAGAGYSGGKWLLRPERGETITADVLVNAAGAWADEVAKLAGVAALGIEPYRRTIAQLRTSPVAPTNLPLVVDIGGTFYFKPEGDRVWLSPHDETPSPPCDAAAEELDVAIAIDRMQQVVGWQVERVEHRWAGLRSFAPDRLPVYGSDRTAPSFFWFAGQGGFGIQTAPAAARLGAQLLLQTGADAMTETLDPERYSPGRFG